MVEIVGPVTTNGAVTFNVTGMIIGLLVAVLDVMVMEPLYDPCAIPAVFTVTTNVEGVVPDEADTLSQLGDVAMLNGSAATLPVRPMDWTAGFVPPLCPVNVRLVALAVNVGLPETTRETKITCGELVALALMMEMVAV
jgi:hypothetical protein